ncbi:MAG: sulfurtransferase TusA family protein [Thaumarchaeota archaeon]|nr:sulfurtransferase TusA family protein [Nitrososphaerota archaeon]
MSNGDNAENIRTDKVLDARGLYCPEPVYKTRVEMDSMNVGQIIHVMADDPAAEEDISRWAVRVGQELLRIDKKGEELHFFLKKTK